MSSEITVDSGRLADALRIAGRDNQLRQKIFDALREAEQGADDGAHFRETVRWPLIVSLLREARFHRVVLDNGLVFDVGADSRIERSLLLSTAARPDHVWEPQTTKLLVALALGVDNLILGGAYIGDQVIPVARAMAVAGSAGTLHAFEPMTYAFERLVHHLTVNHLDNVVAHQFALWRTSRGTLRMQGHLALASAVAANATGVESGEAAVSISIDDYVVSRALRTVGLIALDLEGGEENALTGARETIDRDAPNLVFEIHRNHVDWSLGLERTSVVTCLTSRGYRVFAVRDFHNNHPAARVPVEIIPASAVYLEGPPHGFNMLATKDADLPSRLGLKIVENVSPKLLPDQDPLLHSPLSV